MSACNFGFNLQCNRLLRWCPSPDCNNAIKVQYVEARPVTCKCTHTFCFACGENWHDPVKCHLLRKWIKKCDDDSETSNWIAANTKVCKVQIKLGFYSRIHLSILAIIHMEVNEKLKGK